MENNNLKGQPINILLVEDNEDHAALIKRNFSEHRVANNIHHVFDGEAALDYLFHKGDYSDPAASPKPNVILLDLRLPKIDGLEVLQKIKAVEETNTIPVVVLTTSSAELDMLEAYKENVNSYLVKPVDFRKFSNLMEDLGFYWLMWNRCPV